MLVLYKLVIAVGKLHTTKWKLEFRDAQMTPVPDSDMCRS